MQLTPAAAARLTAAAMIICAYVTLGPAAITAQVDWGVIEGGEVPGDAAAPVPAVKGTAAPRGPVATGAEQPAPVAKALRAGTAGRARARSGQAGTPPVLRGRPELAREFPLEDVDVASLLRSRPVRQATTAAGEATERWVPAETPLVIDEPSAFEPAEPPPAELAKSVPVTISAQPAPAMGASVASEGAAVPVIEEELAPGIIDESAPVPSEAPALQVTNTAPVAIEQQAPPEPAAAVTMQGEEPLLIDEAPPAEADVPEIAEERPLLIEGAALPANVSAAPASVPGAGAPEPEEGPLVIEEEAPQ